MKLFRLIGYFSQLRAFVGFRAASAFTVSYIRNKISPPRGGSLAHIPVGHYVFYFSSLAYFEGLFSEIFFKETYYLVPTQEPIRVIDCGANIGMSLLYIKIRAPRAQVICFEPNPAALAVLKKNIEANGWGEEVQVFPYALGKKKGAVEFFVEDKEATSSGGSTANYLEKKGRVLNSYFVEVDTLSGYITSDVSLLKIDIEGGEFDVIEELVAQNKLQLVATMQLEYHYIPDFFTRPLSDMLALLEENGFHTYVQPTAPPHQVVGHTTPHAYMIFAWRNP